MNENGTGMNRPLEGQGAIVTGGGRNIGRAIAQELARAGVKVAILARTADQIEETVSLIQQEGGEALAFQVDVTDGEAVERAVREAEQRFGTIDLLVNSAGGSGAGGDSFGPIWHEDVDPDAWWRNVEINLRGPFLCSRAVLPGMIERRSGRIINISSGVGAMKSVHGSAYAAGKSALTKFSENVAEEVKEFGVKVFAISPGLVRNQVQTRLIEEGIDEKWFGGAMQRMHAAGVAVPPTRAAELAHRIASGEADALSGCFLDVDDDLSAMVENAEEIQEKELYALRLRTPG